MKPEIAHIVVLMMENHSFDHMLGWLPGVGTLTGDESCPVDPRRPDGERIPVGRGAPFATDPDPRHDLLDTNRQLFGRDRPADGETPTMDGFVWDYERWAEPADGSGNAHHPGTAVMDCCLPEQLPVLSTLATDFATCRRWHASVPGPTGPNRLFVHCASSGGYAGDQYQVTPTDPASFPTDLPTVFESLDVGGRSWGVYWSDFSTAAALDYPRSHPERFHRLDQFFAHAKAGRLPSYAFLTPSLGPSPEGQPATSQHPVYDIRPGDALMGEVYETVRRDPELWRRTLLLVVYDEHGGFWDSVPPPWGVPNPDGRVYPVPPGFDFTRLGVRVPAVVISPWVEPTVDDTVFEHASVPATLKSLFALDAPFLSRRDAHAATFDRLLTRTSPRTDAPRTLERATPPDEPPPPRPPNGLQRELMSLARHLLAAHDHPLTAVEPVATDREATRFLRRAMEALLATGGER